MCLLIDPVGYQSTPNLCFLFYGAVLKFVRALASATISSEGICLMTSLVALSMTLTITWSVSLSMLNCRLLLMLETNLLVRLTALFSSSALGWPISSLSVWKKPLERDLDGISQATASG